MPVSNRGRSGLRSAQGIWGFSTSSGAQSYGRSRSSGKRNSRTNKSSTTKTVPASYKSVNNAFQGKMNSYKTLYNQTWGPAKFSRPSTSVLNTFSNWVNKGAVIQICTCAQLSRWARTTNKAFNSRNATPAACKNVLNAKFGKSTIKAVARTKTGGFMVATSPVVQGRTFCFPK